MEILRDTLRDHLYSKHSLLPSLCSNSLISLLVVQINPFSSHCWLDSNLNFQFNGVIIVSPDGSIPPSGTKTVVGPRTRLLSHLKANVWEMRVGGKK
jgi:hypothetical protein